MNNMMKSIVAAALGSIVLVSSGFSKTPEGWVSGVDDAFADAKAKNKHVMMLFTGSDFCPPCKMMEKKVFSKAAFMEEATKNFILVYLDYPNGDEELARSNEKYMTKYDVEGYPTVLVFDPTEREIGRFYANEFPEVDAYLNKLETVKDRGELD